MNIYKQKINNRMQMKCAYCGKKPQGTRIFLETGYGLNQNKERYVFCNKEHAVKWFKRALKRGW